MDIYSAKTFSDAGQFLSELDAQIKQLEDLVKAVGRSWRDSSPRLSGTEDSRSF
jgi:hypothetical protein